MKKKEYEFCLVLKRGTPIIDLDLAEKICEKRNDSFMGGRYGISTIHFDAMAESFIEAVMLAIEDIESISQQQPLKVVRVEPGNWVCMEEIGVRVELHVSEVHSIIIGKDKSIKNAYPSYNSVSCQPPDSFPSPVLNIDSPTPLWDWTEVSQWFYSVGKLGLNDVKQAQDIIEINKELSNNV